MDHRRLHVSINTPQKPSKIIELLALVFAFALPFILVKTFPHKQKPRFTNKSMSQPTIIPLHSHTKEITTNLTRYTTCKDANQNTSRTRDTIRYKKQTTCTNDIPLQLYPIYCALS